MLDRLPAWGRHAVVLCLIAPLVAALGVLTLAVLTAGGVHVAWADTLDTALDTWAVSLAGGVVTMVAMFVTPLTRQYGAGSQPEQVDEP